MQYNLNDEIKIESEISIPLIILFYICSCYKHCVSSYQWLHPPWDVSIAGSSSSNVTVALSHILKTIHKSFIALERL